MENNGNGFREVKSGKGATVPARAMQTFPDFYSDKNISETQRYKMLGNSWTVEVVAYIFGFLPYPFTVK